METGFEPDSNAEEKELLHGPRSGRFFFFFFPCEV